MQYGTFSPEDACNFAVNIYEDGKVLSIVVDAGSHGTHVSTAQHSPVAPPLGGGAPGRRRGCLPACSSACLPACLPAVLLSCSGSGGGCCSRAVTARAPLDTPGSGGARQDQKSVELAPEDAAGKWRQCLQVAGITAAYHPEDPDLNGIAPGASAAFCSS